MTRPTLVRSLTTLTLGLVGLAASSAGVVSENKLPTFASWAQTPPMGWNSWDCFATTITEEQTKQQADYMAAQLKAFGWEYIVVDIQWYEPGAKSHDYRSDAVLTMDGFGRLQPAPNRFPSSKDGSGFRELARYVHSLGLKFGIHLMRGIPRQAVEKDLPILGTHVRASQIADKVHVCPWNPDMYGVDMSKPGAQEYYDSVFALIAEWGVDFVKVDDLSRPYFQNQPEVEAIRRAIDKTGRPMVLSLSPGATDIRAADHVVEHANMWRISDDFWDRWLSLKEQFWRLEQWNPHRRAGAWPDADMLPLGTLILGARGTRFTIDEQYTLMTLWSIARSPLMHGGDLTKTDPFTLSLLTNRDVLAVNQHSTDNQPLFNRGGLIAWMAKDPATAETYLALFNARDRVELTTANARQAELNVTASGGGKPIEVNVSDGKKLFLVAEPADEASAITGVAWKAPRFVMKDGTELPLTTLKWTHADAQWDSTGIKEGDLTALASAVIEYAIPSGAVSFRAEAAVASGAAGRIHFLTVVGNETNEDLGPGLPIAVDLREWSGGEKARVTDLWTGKSSVVESRSFAPVVPFHGAKLYRIGKVK